ncbi:hypothetical protein DBR32_14585 [Taibaiella sp. KBW10]|nr:hypothetical protein DBR32_14585 [Taibaiella sp. KBW10]
MIYALIDVQISHIITTIMKIEIGNYHFFIESNHRNQAAFRGSICKEGAVLYTGRNKSII